LLITHHRGFLPSSQLFVKIEMSTRKIAEAFRLENAQDY